ncbi:SpoIIE family protein phosphatase [Streptodolium elevatio]
MAADEASELFGDVAGLCAALVDGTEAGVAVFDADLRFRYVNPALARINGVPAADHIGRRVREVVPEVDAREDVMRLVLADGVARVGVTTGHTHVSSPHEQRYWRGSFHRIALGGGRPGLALVIQEVSEDRRLLSELERARERLLLLDAAAVRIGTTLDVETTCQELADLLTEAIADGTTVEVLPGRGENARSPKGRTRLRRTGMAARPALRSAMRGFGVPGQYVDYQATATITRVLQTGRAEVDNQLDDEALGRRAPSPDRVGPYREAGIHSILVVPLSARGARVGTATMVRQGDSPPFDDDDVAVAQALADRAAISLDNARRYAREHGIAVELQRSLLATPGRPGDGLEVVGRYLPAGAQDLVGGDWFDSVRLPGGWTMLAIGDVMGHGVEAAVEMSQYRAVLRVLAAMDIPPNVILQRMDTLLTSLSGERPATLLLGAADPTNRVCAFANAGHLPPAFIAPDGSVSLVRLPEAPPIGVGVAGPYSTVVVRWPEDHTLLLYTDGLVERRGVDIDHSLDQLAGLRLTPGASPETLIDEIVSALAQPSPDDDTAVLLARVVPPEAGKG